MKAPATRAATSRGRSRTGKPGAETPKIDGRTKAGRAAVARRMRAAPSAAERKEAAAELGSVSSKPRRRRAPRKTGIEDHVPEVGGSSEHSEPSPEGMNGTGIDTEE